MLNRKVAPFSWRDWLIVALLGLASVHCVRSIFLVNVSLVDLPKYAQGTERIPFQGRIIMMPVLRWAPTNHTVRRAAAFLDDSLRRTPHFAVPPESVTPEKFACIAVGLLATWIAVAFAVIYGRWRFAELWWLPASMFLFMLFITYAARYEAQYWYPYDLLHIAIFGVASICILEGGSAAAFLLFLMDLPVRETAIFLVPLTLAIGYAERRRSAIWWALAMLTSWLPVHLFITYTFAGNPTEAAIHWVSMGRALANPLHWPQIASAFGFLLLPFCFDFQLLTRKERWLVYGALPGLALIALYGIWYETRVWDEWLLPFSVLLSSQMIRRLNLKPSPEALQAQSRPPISSRPYAALQAQLSAR